MSPEGRATRDELDRLGRVAPAVESSLDEFEGFLDETVEAIREGSGE